MHFSHSFAWSWRFEDLRIQTLENGFQSARFRKLYYRFCVNYKNANLCKQWRHVHMYYVFSHNDVVFSL